MERRVRIGIDVGGTFTHAVALADPGGELLASTRVPTTHFVDHGVAQGVLEALKALMEKAGVQPEQVSRVAHSTTQATNALLEGDVARIGILAVGKGKDGARVREATHLEEIPLAPGRRLKHNQVFVEQVDEMPDDAIRDAIASLVRSGAQALVAAAAFSVDQPETELHLLELAAEAGLPATATHEVSQLYGLRVRTRTAAVNAAILPKMIETADRTEQAVRELGIEAPLVVMRSDGGAMDIAEMRRRPILTILSGPAAGVAAALMAARISDGIFVEVGGTSTDISCIRDGRPYTRQAQVGPHRLYLETLDVRTVGIAGGSVTRLGPRKKVRSVGPRSAHIAGLRYAAFPDGEPVADGARIELTTPLPRDHHGFAVLHDKRGRWTVTPTCAAHALGRIPEFDPARGSVESAQAGVKALATYMKRDPHELAAEILEVGGQPLRHQVGALMDEYDLEPSRTRLVGGGGGASTWVPWLGETLGVSAEVAENAAVISAIGAALALLQETLERNLVDPSPEDLTALRGEAEAALVAAGADPATVEVRVEVDKAKGVVRAVAVGSHAMVREGAALPPEELRIRAAMLMEAKLEDVAEVIRVGPHAVFQGKTTTKKMFGLVKKQLEPWRILDERGRARYGAPHGEVVVTTVGAAAEALEQASERHANFGDAGKVLPATFALVGIRALDLSGFPGVRERQALLQEETRHADPEEPVVLALRLGER